MVKRKIEQQGEDLFTALCRSTLGIEVVREHRFHTTRKWRFDYAVLKYKVAIEIDGGVWAYGRHNRAAGYIADMEKFNAAAASGWVVLKFTPQQQYLPQTLELIEQACNSRNQ